VDVGLKTTYTLVNLQEGATYYFAVKAYDKVRTIESGFSNEVSNATPPPPPPPPIGPLPSPWLAMDIGNVGLVGSASYTNGTFTLSGSGTDIWGTTDAFHYVYQPLNGNGQIVAKVTNIANTNSWAKAGVMIRENLDANARHAMVVVTPGNGVAFQYRRRTGRSSYHTAGASVRAPYWVKLVRTGNTFKAYQSANGSTWALINSATIYMATTVYVGLAVTSHNNSTLTTATLTNVNIISQ
jgi:regulation of enolase protein 1 (concanavalin A-like superfamily)